MSEATQQARPITVGEIQIANIPVILQEQQAWLTHTDKKPNEFWMQHPEQLMTCPVALKKATDNRSSGIGFVFIEGGGYTGIDLDHCVVDGKMNEVARAFVAAFGSYTEYSPSGTGIHIIIKSSEIPVSTKGYVVYNRVNKQINPYDKENPAHDKPEYYAKQVWEIYPHRKYFTFTGNVIKGHTVVNDGEEPMRKFLEKFQKSTAVSKIEPAKIDKKDKAARLGASTLDGEIDTLRGALAAITDSSDYQLWFTIGRALKHAGLTIGDSAAFGLFSAWSSKAGNYCQAEVEKKWKEESDGKITQATIFYHALQAKWDRQAITVDGTKYLAERALPEIYWDAGNCSYIRQVKDGSWIRENESQVKSILADFYHISKSTENCQPSDADRMLNRIRDTQNIDYSGPLAGWTSGLHTICNSRMLITSDPSTLDADKAFGTTIIPPVTILRIIKGLFDNDHDQVESFLGWLKTARECLDNHVIRYGQMVVICGPKDCGKSWLQTKIITPVVGGRAANPYQFMTQETTFNGDLIQAEHLAMMDVTSRTDMKSRLNFGDQIKQITAQLEQRCHDKGRKAVTMLPLWRVSLSLNDEAEVLMTLPPISGSMEDKFLLLRAVNGAMPNTTNTEQWVAFDKLIESEMRGFIEFLHNWEIPERLRHSRYGIKAYYHKHYRDALDELSPESHMLVLIDRHMAEFNMTEWSAGAGEIREALMTSNVTSFDAKSLLSWYRSAQNYLSILSKRIPERVQAVRTMNKRSWKIVTTNHSDQETLQCSSDTAVSATIEV